MLNIKFEVKNKNNLTIKDKKGLELTKNINKIFLFDKISIFL